MKGVKGVRGAKSAERPVIKGIIRVKRGVSV